MSAIPSLFAGIGFQFFSNNGVPLAGGLVYSYLAGTTTPVATYTTYEGITQHPNPIVLDSAGRVPSGGAIWLKEGDTTDYKFVLKNANNVLIATYDNVPGTYNALNLENTTNPVLGDNLVGFRQSNSSGNLPTAVGRTVHDKLQEFVSVKDFGTVGAAALQAALAASDYVFVDAGTYNGPIDIILSDKTLIMDEGVEFFLPNNTISGDATSGPAVFQISGDNITIQGNFTVNGNKANNFSTSFPTSVRTGSLTILGNNCQIYGSANVVNAYYVGALVGDSLVSGGEVQGFYANKINVANANFYSVMLWSVVDWRIEEIRATADVTSITRDQRIRTGTQGTSTSVCARGYLGFAYTGTNCAFVGESRTIDVSIDTIMTGDGGKLEECTNVRVGHWNAYDCSRAAARSAFFLNGCINCHVDSVIVNKFQNDGSNIFAVGFDQVNSCSVGSILSVGNLSNVPSNEVQIREANGLYIGDVVLRDPVGTCNGFLYDHGYPIQQDIVVNNLVSRGHTTWDLIVENKTSITIRSINLDALNQFPQNTYYPNINDKNFYEEGAWVPTYTTNGVDFNSVTYTSSTLGRFVRVGKVVHFSGFIRTTAITVGLASGAVCLGGLPFTVKNNGGAYAAISIANVAGFAGDNPINGRTVPNTNIVELFYRTSSNGVDNLLAIADLGTGTNNNSMTFGGSYEIE